jgi:hypothetical protein
MLPVSPSTRCREKIPAGFDGSLNRMKAPVDVHIDHKVLRVVFPRDLVKTEIAEAATPDQEALLALSGPSS